MSDLKIFDCSGSKEAPPHRKSSGGPVQNDIMADLHKYSRLYGAEFVDNPEASDIIITNDVYPAEILILNKPRVKRMDGIFWQNNLVARNELLNRAALQSDCVIFISSYSEISYAVMYGDRLEDSVVILNNADNTVFNRTSRVNRKPNERFTLAASASNWGRSEKRFKSLMEFANNIRDDIYLMGQCDESEINLPPNIIRLGNIKSQEEMATILNHSEAFVNFSYRDAAPKVVCQAINCGLPILYAHSGGTAELVCNRGFGVGIKDKDDLVFEDVPYDLNIGDIMEKYYVFKRSFEQLAKQAGDINQTKCPTYFETFIQYFDTFRKYSKKEEYVEI